MARGTMYENGQHWLRRAWKRKLLAPEQGTSGFSFWSSGSPRILNGYLRSIGQTNPMR